MKADIPKLIDAICDAFAMSLPGEKWAPDLISTYCNEAVNYVACKMEYFGFCRNLVLEKWEAVMANEMIAIMEKPDYGWLSVSGTNAQYHANKGVLVIAGLKNPDGHGHVCVVRPGVLQHSNSWQAEAPKVMNVGKIVFIDKKASFAFKVIPQYYVLKEMV
jgi:hypothetical protein